VKYNVYNVGNFICSVFIYRQVNARENQIEGAITNGQSRDTSNIGYTRHRTKKNKTNKR